ncbi:MAG TPA: ABC transporter substrate-binding protein [Trueperaceae bacterium]|nr:ABC transporter substrate-binding protein [Trueperaceae bacterium]
MPTVRVPALLLLATVILTASQPAFSQAAEASNGLLIGVITSRAGAAQATGASQALAADAWAEITQRAGGIYGVPVEVRLADDGGVPARALAAAESLISAGAHALVCCTTAAAARSVAELAESEGVLLISPSDPAQARFDAPPSYWAFSLWPSESDALAAVVAHASATGRGSLALMTLDNEFGSGASDTLGALLGYAGMRLAAEHRYSPNVQELRPEALLIASHQPGGVVVWGLPRDTEIAVSALRARGYEGPVYARSALLAPGALPLPPATFAGVRFAVPPSLPAGVADADALAAQTQCEDTVSMNRERLAQQYRGVARLDAAAPVLAALDFIAAGVEQLIAIQLPPTTSLAVRRQALRDALVGLRERCGASGLIDFEEGRLSAIVPRGLVAVRIATSGALEVR